MPEIVHSRLSFRGRPDVERRREYEEWWRRRRGSPEWLEARAQRVSDFRTEELRAEFRAPPSRDSVPTCGPHVPTVGPPYAAEDVEAHRGALVRVVQGRPTVAAALTNKGASLSAEVPSLEGRRAVAAYWELLNDVTRVARPLARRFVERTEALRQHARERGESRAQLRARLAALTLGDLKSPRGRRRGQRLDPTLVAAFADDLSTRLDSIDLAPPRWRSHEHRSGASPCPAATALADLVVETLQEWIWFLGYMNPRFENRNVFGVRAGTTASADWRRRTRARALALAEGALRRATRGRHYASPGQRGLALELTAALFSRPGKPITATTVRAYRGDARFQAGRARLRELLYVWRTEEAEQEKE